MDAHAVTSTILEEPRGHLLLYLLSEQAYNVL